MKKKLLTILVGLSLVFIFGTEAMAKEYKLTLVNSTSGTTTAASGVSELYVDLSGTTYVKGLGDFKSPICTIQIETIGGLKVSEAQQGAGGDWSGTTVTLRYKESLNPDLLPYAETVNIWNGLAFSGNTPYMDRFYPEATGVMALEVVSGITELQYATFILKIVQDN